MKGGIYELTMVIIFLLIAGMLWTVLGYGLKSVGENMKEIIPNRTAFNQTPESDVKSVMDWPVIAFFVYLLFVAIVSIIWAVKKTQVQEYE